MKRTRKRKKSKKNKTKKVYDKGDFSSGDGMLTSVWVLVYGIISILCRLIIQ